MHLIHTLNKAFENRIRLGIMSALLVNEYVDFLTMKDLLHITDGNLASHIAALEKVGYLKVEKKFVGKKTSTTYQATALGRKEFTDHIEALGKLLQNKFD